MTNIPIKRIIRIDNPEEYKFHAARWNRIDAPLDVYVKDKIEWDKWNMWYEKRNDFSRQYIFSLIDFPDFAGWPK